MQSKKGPNIFKINNIVVQLFNKFLDLKTIKIDVLLLFRHLLVKQAFQSKIFLFLNL